MIRIEFFRDKEKMGYQCILRNIMNMVNIMSINCFTVFSMFTKKSLYDKFFGYATQSFFKANQVTNGKYPCMKLAHGPNRVKHVLQANTYGRSNGFQNSHNLAG